MSYPENPSIIVRVVCYCTHCGEPYSMPKDAYAALYASKYRDLCGPCLWPLA